MTARFETIVVGIDTAELSHAVLDWAVEDAQLHPDRRSSRHRREVGARLP